MADKSRRSFGWVRKLPSGRLQASHLDPAGNRVNAPDTFDTRKDADAWLSTQRAGLAAGTWTEPAPTAPVIASDGLMFGTFAAAWLASRDVKPRTRSHYRDVLAGHILPTFEAMPVDTITATHVRTWYASVAQGRPTLRSHAYGLLRTILGTALDDELITRNPCRIKGAGSVERASTTTTATDAELDAVVAALPPRYRVAALLSSWCALRFGELTELRRKDVDLKRGVVHVRRGVTHPDGKCTIAEPKAGSRRDVTIPPHLTEAIAAHLLEHCATGRDGLLFPPAGDGCHMKPSTLYKVFYRARDLAGRPDLRWHDLRHTGLVYLAEAGATLAELKQRAGHKTAQAAMRYQSAASGRDRVLADKLSDRAKETAKETANATKTATVQAIRGGRRTG